MKNLFLRFVKEESGQDLIEYTLLLAFVALISAALFIGAGQATSGIWSITSTSLSTANECAATAGS
jgi:Flp pilus assembly pilin Flp